MTVGSTEWQQQADREKHRAALSSVLAAIFLTLVKLVVGLLTGSLGILAEVAHSGLDLVAAAVTLFAVRVSGRPADQEHMYGHGKVENLSALFETLLLLVTCAWIIYEAIQRLFFEDVVVEVSIWAFLVMFLAIGIDFSRSRMLSRVAKKYNSQALEADALHFSTDIWSSTVVIVGLTLVVISDWLGIPLAGEGRLGRGHRCRGHRHLGQPSARQAHRDGAAGRGARLRARRGLRAVRVPGVVEVRQVRVRRSGPEAFADVRLSVSRDVSFERTHDIAAAAEAAVREILPGADVVVQVEPVRADHEGWVTTVRLLAARHGLGAHGIRIYDLGKGGHSVELHLEVSDELSLDAAHTEATAFEQALREAIPGITQVITHIEPTGDAIARRESTAADEANVRRIVENLSDETGLQCHPHDLTVRRAGGELQVTFHCTMEADTPITDAHAITEQVESVLRGQVPNLGRVVIHVEPTGA